MKNRLRRGVTVACAALAALATAGAGGVSPTVAEAATPDEVRLTGTLLTAIVEPSPGHPRGARQVVAPTALRVDDRLVPVESEAVSDIEPGSTVTLDVVVPETVAEAANEAGTTSPTELAEATTTAATEPGTPPLEVADVVATTDPPTETTDPPGSRALTVVKVTPKGTTRTPPSDSAVAAQVAAADQFWRDNSSGKVGMRIAATSPAYRSTLTCDDPFALWDEAIQRTGYVDAENNSLMLVLPDLPDSLDCPYGFASIGSGLRSPGLVMVQGSSPDVLAHEVGHNMSLEHSNLLTCTDRTSDVRISRGWWPSGCTEWEYGDGQDIMSGDLINEATNPPTNPPSPLLSIPQAMRLGLLERGTATSVPVGRTTRVTINALTTGTGIRGVSVLNDLTRVRYWVEYRYPLGQDRFNTNGQRTGVRVLRLGPDGTTVLLDPTPTGRIDGHQALTTGRTVATYDGHLRVKTVATYTDSAVIDIASYHRTTLIAAVRPSIEGTRLVGRTLTARTGSWHPTPSRYTYRWYRGSTAIPGATGRTYTPTRADAGRSLSVRVTGYRTGSSAATARSAATAIPIYATSRATISGTPRLGRTLTARSGSWTPKPTGYTYRWYRGSTPIPGATARTYRLTSRDVGSRIRVRVIASRAGSRSGGSTSLATPTITR